MGSKNTFMRLTPENKKFLVRKAKEKEMSQTVFINKMLDKAREKEAARKTE